MPVKMQTVSVKARNMYVSHDTLFPNQTLGKLNKNSMMICPRTYLIIMKYVIVSMAFLWW